ncbi:hypothetical protein [Amycolatopsis sp. NPDC051102]|uniref:hypothetical protein n=1 Tax=Amycolatopsis sp. NPDC051102 TaxID=3155163 RepID=UPI003440FF3D
MSSLARWCFRRRGVVLAGWVGGLVALALLVFGAGTAFTDTADLPDSESATASHLLGGAGSANVVRGTIVWHTGDVGAEPVRDRVDAVLGDISALPGVKQVVSPYTPAGAAQLNAEAGTAYAMVVLDKDAVTALGCRLGPALRKRLPRYRRAVRHVILGALPHYRSSRVSFQGPG